MMHRAMQGLCWAEPSKESYPPKLPACMTCLGVSVGLKSGASPNTSLPSSSLVPSAGSTLDWTMSSSLLSTGRYSATSSEACAHQVANVILKIVPEQHSEYSGIFEERSICCTHRLTRSSLVPRSLTSSSETRLWASL